MLSCAFLHFFMDFKRISKKKIPRKKKKDTEKFNTIAAERFSPSRGALIQSPYQ